MTSKDTLFNNNRAMTYVRGQINPFIYKYSSPFVNHQKNVVEVQPIIFPSTSGIFNRRYVFEVPKNYGYLSSVFIKTTLTCTGDNTDVQDRLGSRIYKDIQLQTRRGPNCLMQVCPDYINGRLDSLNNQILFDSIGQSMEPDVTFDNTSVTTFTPVPFFISESGSLALPTDYVEQLQVLAITADSADDMGLPSDTLTVLTCTMIMVSWTLEQYNYRPQVLPVHNVYYEPALALDTSSTSDFMYLTCSRQVFNMCMVIRNANQEYHRINSFRLESNGQTLIPTMDRRINYEFKDSSGATENNTTGTYSFWFTKTKDRLRVFGSGMNLDGLEPLRLTVNYDSIGAGYSLYVYFEYVGVLQLGPTGAVQVY
jgi:hypothetical protein